MLNTTVNHISYNLSSLTFLSSLSLSLPRAPNNIHLPHDQFLNKFCTILHQLSEWHLASLFCYIRTVLVQYQLVYIAACHAVLDAILHNGLGEFVGSVKNHLYAPFGCSTNGGESGKSLVGYSDEVV